MYARNLTLFYTIGSSDIKIIYYNIKKIHKLEKDADTLTENKSTTSWIFVYYDQDYTYGQYNWITVSKLKSLSIVHRSHHNTILSY